MNRLPLVILILAILWMGCQPTVWAETQQQIFQSGVAAYQKGAYQTAMSRFKLALSRESKQSPNIRQLLYNYGLAAYRANAYPEAEKAFKQVIPLTKDNPNIKGDTLAHLGILCQTQKRYDEAKTHYQQALSTYATHKGSPSANISNVKHNLAGLEALLAKLNEASTEEDDLVVSTPDETVSALIDLVNSATQAVQSNRKEEAFTLFSQAYAQLTETTPKPVAAYTNLALGQLYAEQRQFKDAIPLLEKSLTLYREVVEPDDERIPKILKQLVIANQYTGNIDEAQAWNQELAKLPGNQQLTYNQSLARLSKTLSEHPEMLGGVSLTDFQTIRWNDKTRDLLIYIAPGEGARHWKPDNIERLKAAFAEWQAALDNRIKFVFVPSPKEYDVRVDWGNAMQHGAAGEAGGLNRKLFWDDYFGQNDIIISLSDTNNVPFNRYALYATMLHEIGHMLGIQLHSNNLNDIMGGHDAPHEMMEEHHLTQRDIDTVRALYQKKPDKTNPPGIRLSHFESFRRRKENQYRMSEFMVFPFRW